MSILDYLSHLTTSIQWTLAILQAQLGSFADKVAVGIDQLLPLPDNLSYDQGAGIYVTWPTSYEGLVGRTNLAPGEWVLVTAAAGGVGLAAVQIAKGIQNLVISLGAMQVARKIPFDDPVVLNYVRAGYVFSQLVILGVYYYVSLTEPPAPMSQETGKLVTTTVRDYDLSETSKLLRSTYMGVAMMGVMHLYFNFIQPLFIQSLMGFKGLYDAKLVTIYLLGKPATGDLKHSFKAASMFGAASAGPQIDAASIAEAEKHVDVFPPPDDDDPYAYHHHAHG